MQCRLIDTELIPLRSVITSTLAGNEGFVSVSISNMCDGFAVKGSCDAPGPSAAARLIRLRLIR